MVPRRNILHVITTLEPEGAQILLLGTCKHLDQGKYCSRIAFLCRRATALEDQPPQRTEVLDLSRSGNFDPTAVLRLARWIRKLRIDIVHTHLVHAGILGRVAARMAGVKQIVTTRHYGYEGKQRTFLYRMEDRAIASSTVVIAVSEAVRRDLIARGLVPPEKIEVIPNGIDPEEFDPERYGARIATDGPIIGSLGRLQSQKGFDLLLRGFSLVAQRLPGVQLEIVGTGTLYDDLRRLAVELKVADRVRFSGALPHRSIPGKLASWDLYVQPSRWEGAGIAVLEAMAMRKPVIASRVEGILETVEDDVTGLLVAPNDPEALAGAILRLANDRSRCAAMGRAGQERVIRHFSIREAAQKLERVYDRLIVT